MSYVTATAPLRYYFFAACDSICLFSPFIASFLCRLRCQRRYCRHFPSARRQRYMKSALQVERFRYYRLKILLRQHCYRFFFRAAAAMSRSLATRDSAFMKIFCHACFAIPASCWRRFFSSFCTLLHFRRHFPPFFDAFLRHIRLSLAYIDKIEPPHIAPFSHAFAAIFERPSAIL